MQQNDLFPTAEYVGGVGITPPSCPRNSKTAGIDWFTLTFDKIKYSVAPYVSIDFRSQVYLDELLKVLTSDKSYDQCQKDYGRNNYKSSITIGEHILIQFKGPQNNKGNHTTMVELNGSACREFLERGGDFVKLIQLMIKWDARCTRFDLRIDDFSGKEVNIYDLWENYIKKFYFTSPFQNFYPQMPMNIKLETYQGFGIYFGTRGSNQLLIYDKKLERENAGEEVYSKVWYRYEMRFTGGKATTIMHRFLTTYLESQDCFNEFAFRCLYDCLDVKEPNLVEINGELKPKNMRKRVWDTAQCWLDFLEDVKKMKIVNEFKPEITLERKKDWVNRSVLTSLAQLFIVDESSFVTNQLLDIGKKLKDLKDKDLEIINKYLRENEKNEITKEDLINKSSELIQAFQFREKKNKKVG